MGYIFQYYTTQKWAPKYYTVSGPRSTAASVVFVADALALTNRHAHKTGTRDTGEKRVPQAKHIITKLLILWILLLYILRAWMGK